MNQLPFPVPFLRWARASRAGFSLVEAVIALAITAFASVSIISLLPSGLSSFRQAMNNTVESEIVQTLVNNITLTDFKNLQSMAASQGAIYYFDADGVQLPTSAGSLYTAQISFTDLSSGGSGGPLSTLSPGVGTTALITITRQNKTAASFSVVVGNGAQVASSAPAATW